MERLVLCILALLVAAPLSAEWPPTPQKTAFLQQLEAVRLGISSNSKLVNWLKTQRPPAIGQVNAFSAYAIDAYVLHVNALMNLADLYGRFSGPTDRPIYGCNPPTPCGPELEPPLPPREQVLALAQTLMSEAVSKYALADQQLAVVEASYSSAAIVQARNWFNTARNAAQTIDWNLRWAVDPRPKDGVLSAPGATRDKAPAYYPFGTWFGAGREMGQAFNHLSLGWKTMIDAATYEPASLNEGAFANRHEGGLESLVSALGLMVAVETSLVRPHLDWMSNAAPGVPRQDHRWILAFEILQNIDPGGSLGSGAGGAPRGFDFSGRSLIETASPAYNSRQICYPMVDFLLQRFPFQADPFVNRYLLSLRHNCEANFRLGNAAYRLVKHKHYSPIPPANGGPPLDPCSACGPGTTCVGGTCRPSVTCNPFQLVVLPGANAHQNILECVEVRP